MCRACGQCIYCMVGEPCRHLIPILPPASSLDAYDVRGLQNEVEKLKGELALVVEFRQADAERLATARARVAQLQKENDDLKCKRPSSFLARFHSEAISSSTLAGSNACVAAAKVLNDVIKANSATEMGAAVFCLILSDQDGGGTLLVGDTGVGIEEVPLPILLLVQEALAEFIKTVQAGEKMHVGNFDPAQGQS
jgi:hypothetical protein